LVSKLRKGSHKNESPLCGGVGRSKGRKEEEEEEKKKKKKKKKWNAQIYHRLFVQWLTVKVCLFQNSRQILPRQW
jgi:hypothetical protein